MVSCGRLALGGLLGQPGQSLAEFGVQTVGSPALELGLAGQGAQLAEQRKQVGDRLRRRQHVRGKTGWGRLCLVEIVEPGLHGR